MRLDPRSLTAPLTRRRRRPRPDAPRTIVPELTAEERAALDRGTAEDAPAAPLSLDALDAARSRLRASIPPRADDE